MSKIVTAEAVERVIRRNLERNGCAVSIPRSKGENGADIEASKGKANWFIEAIGFQSHPPTRSREFYEVFFRIISRDRDNSNDILVIGLPKRFKLGMPARRRQYNIAWQKLGKTFPNLKLWYVDTEIDKIEENSWLTPFGGS